MYSLGQLRRGLERGLSTPSFFGRELNRLYYRRGYTRQCNTAGVDVMAEDWNTLVVLDACRYDLFERHADLAGRLERRTSRGSHTREFLRANFSGRDLRDTVYVSATPQLARLRADLDVTFHDVVDVWREDGWDDDYGTVMPETTTEYARRAHEQYPNKRIVVHYLQPHYPFIDAGSDLNVRTFGEQEPGIDVWGALMEGDLSLSPERVWEAYLANLERVLPYVDSLLRSVEGRTVVTADHGNMIADRARPVPIREWGHPPGIYTPELVEVPWLVREADQRRDVVAGEPASTADPVGSQMVTDRLEQLGYV